MFVERNCPNKLPRGSPTRIQEHEPAILENQLVLNKGHLFRAQVPVGFVGKRWAFRIVDFYEKNPPTRSHDGSMGFVYLMIHEWKWGPLFQGNLGR